MTFFQDLYLVDETEDGCCQSGWSHFNVWSPYSSPSFVRVMRYVFLPSHNPPRVLFLRDGRFAVLHGVKISKAGAGLHQKTERTTEAKSGAQ